MPDLNKFAIELLVLAALIAVTLGLALYKMVCERDNDYHIHATSDELASVGKQSAMAGRLESVEKWGKGLTLVTVVYFLVVLGLVLYSAWQQSSQVVLVK